MSARKDASVSRCMSIESLSNADKASSMEKKTLALNERFPFLQRIYFIGVTCGLKICFGFTQAYN